MLRAVNDGFIKHRLKLGQVGSTRCSLIKFERKGAHCCFALHPVEEALKEKMDRAIGEPKGHGHYMPALDKLLQLVAAFDVLLGVGARGTGMTIAQKTLAAVLA